MVTSWRATADNDWTYPDGCVPLRSNALRWLLATEVCGWSYQDPANEGFIWAAEVAIRLTCGDHDIRAIAWQAFEEDSTSEGFWNSLVELTEPLHGPSGAVTAELLVFLGDIPHGELDAARARPWDYLNAPPAHLEYSYLLAVGMTQVVELVRQGVYSWTHFDYVE